MSQSSFFSSFAINFATQHVEQQKSAIIHKTPSNFQAPCNFCASNHLPTIINFRTPFYAALVSNLTLFNFRERPKRAKIRGNKVCWNWIKVLLNPNPSLYRLEKRERWQVPTTAWVTSPSHLLFKPSNQIEEFSVKGRGGIFSLKKLKFFFVTMACSLSFDASKMR